MVDVPAAASAKLDAMAWLMHGFGSKECRAKKSFSARDFLYHAPGSRPWMPQARVNHVLELFVQLVLFCVKAARKKMMFFLDRHRCTCNVVVTHNWSFEVSSSENRASQ